MNASAEKWLSKGYELFALHGPGKLNIEQLARAVGISKSSFYHHFADVEVFTEKLLQQHLQAAALIAEKESRATTVDPDLIRILLEHRTDMLFSRQLRINAAHPSFAATLARANEHNGNHFVNLLLRQAALNISRQQAEGIFELALENFFLQLNVNTMNEVWLRNYFQRLLLLIRKIATPLDGTV